MSVPIPTADAAERDLVGMALATKLGRRLARDRVRADDIWLPQAQRAFASALSPEAAAAEASAPAGYQLETLVAFVARTANVDERWLWSCVNERRSLVDQNGTVAAEVRDSALRRAIMVWASDVHQAAGEGDREALRRLLAGVPSVAA